MLLLYIDLFFLSFYSDSSSCDVSLCQVFHWRHRVHWFTPRIPRVPRPGLFRDAGLPQTLLDLGGGLLAIHVQRLLGVCFELPESNQGVDAVCAECFGTQRVIPVQIDIFFVTCHCGL
mgnify:CR=1 FL=1